MCVCCDWSVYKYVYMCIYMQLWEFASYSTNRWFNRAYVVKKNMKKCVIERPFSPKNIFCSIFPFGLEERGQQTRPVFFTRLWACPLWLQGSGWWLPVCQRPTSLVHFDIHMGAVMILKAAIKLTVAFWGSAWCRHCAAPIIPSGNTP